MGPGGATKVSLLNVGADVAVTPADVAVPISDVVVRTSDDPQPTTRRAIDRMASVISILRQAGMRFLSFAYKSILH
jgi:hypothetical protein